MSRAVIAGFARSPFQPAHKGKLTRVRADDLAATVVKGLVEKTGVDTATLEDLILGCAFPEGEQGMNLARITVLLAGLPISVAGATVNRFCGSSMNSVHMAAGAIAMGAGDAFIAAGVESMSRIPMGGYNFSPSKALLDAGSAAYMGMGETAENLTEKYGISRAEQEAFAVQSHAKAAKAQADGAFVDEIIPIQTPDGVVDTDGCIRADTSAEGLAGLKPAFRANGAVTAGTSSPLTDGCAAVLVCSEDYAAKAGLTPLAAIKSIAVAGCAPEIMGIGPVAAVKKALSRAGLSVDDLDLIESNEAFAVQSMSVAKETGLPIEKTNLHGGALALGHPLGATGARITGKAAKLLKETGGKYALATQCIGGGQGIATVLEAL